MNHGAVRVGVEAIALCCPGLPDWESAQPVLTGTKPYCPAPLVLQPPAELSPAERRRAVPSVKLALGVGAACVAQTGLDPASLPAVFASSGADGETIVAVLAALATPAREVSPTRFHNSVHNAPSGYWGIAVRSRQAVASVSCYDASFAAGLLEAGVQAVAGEQPVLLVAYDLPYPDPLDRARHIDAAFGVALVLRPAPPDRGPSGRGLAELHMTIGPGNAAAACTDPDLEALRRGNPAARSLPLLAALARRTGGHVRLELNHGALDIEIVPC
jgi:lambda repressor-like predicted transcriptional regulator